ncbi:lytic transglycosylase [Rhodococcus rhodnii]|uniref:NlpC/P60 domain-containing protein n=2 Tax=Rhodococcus rhodnii TaxID=38312 RepID=R7WJX0_9NOCA|nr:NlpC/P60 family protein [Rhodococcus rhodnii]EOM75603.1 hypothetical protein Rrhod_3063 [Rhodococcus rhodnii LMG 5362]TXG91876.1 lytic transglycosylase [Rhodococcus rhodnii]
MTADAAAIVVAITTAAGALVQGVGLPEPVERAAADAIAVVEHAAPQIQQQVDASLDALPDDARRHAEDLVARGADAARQAVPPGPIPAPVPGAPGDTPPLPGIPLPDAPLPADQRPGLEGIPFVPEPELGPGPAPQTPAPQGSGRYTAPTPPTAGGSGSGDVVVSGTAPVVGALGSMVPPVSAAFPGPSLAPIGAVAVFAPWIRQAGSVCAEIGPETVASLLSVVSGFRYGVAAPISPSGERGPAQLPPDVWERYAEDADGDGRTDILGVADSTLASGRYLCDTYQQVEAWKREGAVTGDSLDLTLAAYLTSPEQIRFGGAMPGPVADPAVDPTALVKRVQAFGESFGRMLAPFFYGGTGFGASGVVDAAMRYLGLPYVWGGGNINGPTMGGFDCSGLTSYAVHAASGVTLPRTSEMQWRVGTEIPLDQAKPGDLLFGNWGAGGPGHVAIYVGGGQMLHAPTTGDVVRVGALFEGMKARRL